MAKAQLASRVKRILALLWSERKALDDALENLRIAFGSIDYSGEDHLFTHTDYYHAEMGSNLKRRLISFRELAPPESIVQAKINCNLIEEQSGSPNRRVNLDIGYLDHGKVILASIKPAGHKIYLGQVIYVDLIAHYHNRRYKPLDWTFPDFLNQTYDSDLFTIREIYLKQFRTTLKC